MSELIGLIKKGMVFTYLVMMFSAFIPLVSAFFAQGRTGRTRGKIVLSADSSATK